MRVEFDATPTPMQERFLLDRRSRIKALIGGLGSGKTRWGAEALVDLALANPGCETMMAGPTHEMTRDLCLPAFEAALPPELLLRHVKSEHVYELRGARRVKYGSADKPSSLEGRNLAGFWGDEVRYWQHASWRNLLARLRDPRARLLQGCVTTTPAMGWLAEEFDSGRNERAVYRISTRENERNLAPGYLDELRRSYSARLCESLIEGRFVVIAGQVYEEFDEAKHAVSWRYRRGLPLWLSWDFGVRAASILVAQWTGDFPVRDDAGRELPPHSIVVIGELQPEQVPTIHQIPLVKRALAALCPTAPPVPWAIVVDPAGRARDQASGMPSVALLRDAFGPVVRWASEFADRHIPNRIARVQGALAPVAGPPRLYVDGGLVRGHRRGIVAALRGSVYPEKGGRQQSDLPVENELEHARDTTEYLVVGCAIAYGQRAQPPRRLALA